MGNRCNELVTDLGLQSELKGTSDDIKMCLVNDVGDTLCPSNAKDAREQTWKPSKLRMRAVYSEVPVQKDSTTKSSEEGYSLPDENLYYLKTA